MLTEKHNHSDRKSVKIRRNTVHTVIHKQGHVRGVCERCNQIQSLKRYTWYMHIDTNTQPKNIRDEGEKKTNRKEEGNEEVLRWEGGPIVAREGQNLV